VCRDLKEAWAVRLDVTAKVAAALLLATLAVLALTSAPARASSRQLTILQDDALFLGKTARDPDRAMVDAKALGVDVVRVFVTWSHVAPKPYSREKPGGFDAANPGSRGYDWSAYDALVSRARRNGIKLMLTLVAPQPYWASEDPNGCPHPIGGYFFLPRSCHWKPDPVAFGQFASAVARRYGSRAAGGQGGAVHFYSLWNEPNLEHYLHPQVEGRRGQLIDWAGKRYRRLWYEGWKAIAAADPVMRNRVLFGETAAISSPLDTLYAALCLNQEGRPFRGAQRRRQGCVRPRKLPIGGIAIHPYNNHATGSVFTRSFSGDSHPAAYVPRVHRLIDRAARLGRIPRGRRVFLTEFGFQTNPPDRTYGLGLRRHAAALNEADRLYFADRRVAAVAQYELYDPPARRREREENDTYTTGLAFVDGRRKPAWDAFRIPLVVTRLAANAVEVWGQARPAEGSTSITITSSPAAGRPFRPVRTVRTNPAGYFRVRLRRRRAASLSYRLGWRPPTAPAKSYSYPLVSLPPSGPVMRSRTARAGRRIRYLEPARPRARPPRPQNPSR
jgi:hypothetical protein